MRIARTIASAALAIGLTAGLAPAALAASPAVAAPAHSASVHSAAHKGKKPAKVQVKLDLHADDSATAGDTLELKGRLTNRTKHGFKPVAGKVVTVSLLDPLGATVLGVATTDAKGRYTLGYVSTTDQAGSSLRLAASFAGDTTVKAATSKVITTTLEAADGGAEDGDVDETGDGDQ